MLEGIEWFIWAVFAFELVVKTYLAPNRTRYLVSHWPDVLTVAVPFLRPLRLLRVVVVGARLWKQARVVLRDQTFSVIGMTSLTAVCLSAALVYEAEHGGDGPIQTFADALWWAVSTITTVGYGDVYPKTNAGRGVATLLMLVGISLFGLLTARVAAFFVEAGEADQETPKLNEILERLERIERQNAELRARLG
ncbi:MAG TPA: potassium channel family protein [Chloroflexota bacterium]|nr:potassium channel family protein [Chloroflexota bacterium]